MTSINLTKKDLINSIYMQIGFSNSFSACTRTVSGNLIEKIRNNIKNV